MTLIKEYEGSDGRTGRYLKNYNLDVLEKEIFRLTDELEQAQKENNRLQSKLNSITDITTERCYYFDKFYSSQYGYEKNEEMEKTNVALTHIGLISSSK
jgi:hypothetical protein